MSLWGQSCILRRAAPAVSKTLCRARLSASGPQQPLPWGFPGASKRQSAISTVPICIDEADRSDLSGAEAIYRTDPKLQQIGLLLGFSDWRDVQRIIRCEACWGMLVRQCDPLWSEQGWPTQTSLKIVTDNFVKPLLIEYSGVATRAHQLIGFGLHRLEMYN